MAGEWLDGHGLLSPEAPKRRGGRRGKAVRIGKGAHVAC